MNLLNKIESNPNVMLGKPVIKGTRVTVELILRKLSGGFTFEEILEMYPHLQKIDILAAIDYAAYSVANEEVYQ